MGVAAIATKLMKPLKNVSCEINQDALVYLGVTVIQIDKSGSVMKTTATLIVMGLLLVKLIILITKSNPRHPASSGGRRRRGAEITTGGRVMSKKDCNRHGVEWQ